MGYLDPILKILQDSLRLILKEGKGKCYLIWNGNCSEYNANIFIFLKMKKTTKVTDKYCVISQYFESAVMYKIIRDIHQ